MKGRPAPASLIAENTTEIVYLEEPAVKELPDHLDWRVRGTLTMVKD